MILPKLRRVATVGWGTSQMRKEQVGPAFWGFQGFGLHEFQYSNINSQKLAKREKGQVGPAFQGFGVQSFVNSKPNLYTPKLPKSRKVKKRKGGTSFGISRFRIDARWWRETTTSSRSCSQDRSITSCELNYLIRFPAGISDENPIHRSYSFPFTASTHACDFSPTQFWVSEFLVF